MNNETTIKQQHSGSNLDVLIVYDSVRSGKRAPFGRRIRTVRL